jgi:macrolide transport system ATP-binding/permease protein
MNPNWNQIVREHLAVLRLPPEREIEIVEELALHMETVYEAARAAGLSVTEAKARALQSYDWRLLECELSRVEQPLTARVLQPPMELIEREGGIRMESIIKDLKVGMYMLLKHKGWSAVALLSLALGIGANTAIFTFINALVARSLPVAEPERLAQVLTNQIGVATYPDYVYHRDYNQVFAELAALEKTPLLLASGDQVNGKLVSGNYFTTLGISAAQGRTFLPEEDRTPGAHPVAVVSHSFWQGRLRGATDFTNQTLTLNGRSFVVVGVLPERFKENFFAADVFVPLMMYQQLVPEGGPLSDAGRVSSLMEFGRLKPGVSWQQAEAAMVALDRQLEQQTPAAQRIAGRKLALAQPGELPPIFKSPIFSFAGFLLFSAGLVLLIACANVANMLLARAETRRREIAIRLTLGASRWRLIRQLLTESLLLSCLGGALGLLLAFWMTRALLLLKPPGDYTIPLNLNPDYRVLGFTLLLSLVTGVLFGLAPALQASNPDLVSALKGIASFTPRRSRRANPGSVLGNRRWDEPVRLRNELRRINLRQLLLVAQVTISLALLVTAGLFFRSFLNARSIDPGFETKNVLLVKINLRQHGYKASQTQPFFQKLQERVAALPGVQSASMAGRVPLGIGWSFAYLNPPRPGEAPIRVAFNSIGPDYLKTMGLMLVRGREINQQDVEVDRAVLLINETMANQYWPGEDPVGKQLGKPEIIGVVKDIKYFTLGEPPRPFVYLPHTGGLNSTLHIRTAGPPEQIAAAVRQVVQDIDPKLSSTEIKSISEHLQLALFIPRMVSTLFGAFGVLALLLSATGVYGVAAYFANQRTHEFGVRLALGAQSRDIIKLVLRQGLRSVLIGICIGAVVTFVFTGFISILLYDVSAVDPLIYTLIVLLLTGVALLASYMPARRATKVDPVSTLRRE